MGVLGIIVAVPLQSLGGAGILIDSDCMLRRAAELLVAILLLLLPLPLLGARVAALGRVLVGGQPDVPPAILVASEVLLIQRELLGDERRGSLAAIDRLIQILLLLCRVEGVRVLASSLGCEATDTVAVARFKGLGLDVHEGSRVPVARSDQRRRSRRQVERVGDLVLLYLTDVRVRADLLRDLAESLLGAPLGLVARLALDVEADAGVFVHETSEVERPSHPRRVEP